jgi:hypothetical protein
VNTETANEIRDRIRQAPQEIRVLCPRGHFIAHIGLYVSDEGYEDPSTAPIRMHPRGPDKQYVINLHEGSHGFRMALHHPTLSYDVRLHCMNSRCRYSGKLAYIPLAVELAAAALAALDGHAEYRMTV